MDDSRPNRPPAPTPRRGSETSSAGIATTGVRFYPSKSTTPRWPPDIVGATGGKPTPENGARYELSCACATFAIQQQLRRISSAGCVMMPDRPPRVGFS